MKKLSLSILLVFSILLCFNLLSYSEEGPVYDIEGGQTIEISVTAHEVAKVRFTPVVGGEYWFESHTTYDTSCSVCDENLDLLYNPGEDDGQNSGEGQNFRIRYTFRGGDTYYFLCRLPEDIPPITYNYDVSLTMHQPEQSHVHQWNETVTQEPTCTEDGAAILTCICTMSESRVLPPLGHAGPTETVEATCTQKGKAVQHCERCGLDITEVLPALGHEFKAEFVVDKPPTCTATGTKSFHCIRCGLSQSGTTQTVPSNGHSFGEWGVLKPAGCLTTGTDQRICSVCGADETRQTPVLGHDYSSKFTVDKAATCTAAGTKSRHCTRCGDKTDVTVIAEKGHSFGNWVTTKKATCTSGGSKQKSCSACGAVQKKATEALGHKYSTKYTIDKAPTCTAAGTKSFHCSRCSAKTGSVTVKATGHSFGTYKTVLKATCTANGKQTRKCSSCGAEQSKTIAKKGHAFSDKYTLDSCATTEKSGSKSRHCSRCSAVTDKVSIPKIAGFTLSKAVYVFNGNPKKPGVTIKDSRGSTIANKYYKLSYESGCESIGKHYVTVSFSGRYAGTKKLAYRIIPNDVSGLSAKTSGNKITLSWNAVKGADGYKIFIYNAATKAFEPLGETSKTSFSVSLSKGTAYTLAVKASKKVNGTAFSSSNFSKINCATAPDKVNARVTTAGKEATVSWNRVACTGYEVYMSTNLNGSYQRVKRLSSPDALNFTKTSLKSGQLYFFKVRAYVKTGDVIVYSPFSQIVACRVK